MTDSITVDVAIIGSGPAGLSAAIELKQQGIERVWVVERETEAGGIPRHCAHPPYGVREYHRLMTGPGFARRNVSEAKAAGVNILTSTTVTALKAGGVLEVISPDGPKVINARRVLLATGVRETPRSARFVGGDRPVGVFNTATLQGCVHLKGLKPFSRPLIVGTELVSLSALSTCRKAGIKPVAMIDSALQPIARKPLMLYPKMLGVSVYTGAELVAIHGKDRVESASVRLADGTIQVLECDGVLFTGCFVPDTALLLASHLEIDNGSQGPLVDQFGRCSDGVYFAAGNLLRPVETAGWSFREGRRIGQYIARDLNNNLPQGAALNIVTDGVVKYCMPQRLVAGTDEGFEALQVRVNKPVEGALEVTCGDRVLYSRAVKLAPERRVLIPLAELDFTGVNTASLHVRVMAHG